MNRSVNKIDVQRLILNQIHFYYDTRLLTTKPFNRFLKKQTLHRKLSKTSLRESEREKYEKVFLLTKLRKKNERTKIFVNSR